MLSARAQATAANYRGDVARQYDEKRRLQEKWHAENRLVAELTADLPAGIDVLDVPVGTGRFLALYRERGYRATGLDISADMLAVAGDKVLTGDQVTLATGNILAIDRPAASVDLAIAMRIMNLIDTDDMVQALGELQRVARRRILFSLRVGGRMGKLTMPQDVATVVGALRPDWTLTIDCEIHKPHYRMIMLERTA
jgi:ubiquinone/menaquinone biosynthesis C-methylase UbiE